MTVPLDRVQVIKGWVRDGSSEEKIYNIVYSDGGLPNSQGRCSDLEASVDLEQCAPAKNKGAAALSRVWRDPNYDPTLTAFYYLRVLEIPTYRWNHYDALRLGRPLDSSQVITYRERAWSSPIWVSGAESKSLGGYGNASNN